MAREPQYRVLFEGQIVAGTDVETVKKKMMRLFKRTDHEKVEGLFRDGPSVMVEDADLETCLKYKKALASIGALCTIQVQRYIDVDTIQTDADQAEGEEQAQSQEDDSAVTVTASDEPSDPQDPMMSSDEEEEAVPTAEDTEGADEDEPDVGSNGTATGRKKWAVGVVLLVIGLVVLIGMAIFYDVHADFIDSRERAEELKERAACLKEGIMTVGEEPLISLDKEMVSSSGDNGEVRKYMAGGTGRDEVSEYGVVAKGRYSSEVQYQIRKLE